MPELPEVETVRRELEDVIGKGAVFTGIKLLRPDLRDPIPKKKIEKLRGEKLLRVRRRAKYLLFDFASGTLISHLGMTGAWRKLSVGEMISKKAHDHVVLDFGPDCHLVFRDPRRFGILDIHMGNDAERHRRLSSLGVEPLDPALDVVRFLTLLKSGKSPIKSHLMNQKIIVGVGNIYASETLFRAGISPLRKAGKIKPDEAYRLLDEIQKTLHAAIRAGGSSIRDYKSALQKNGGFQDQHLVYGRDKMPCRKCHNPIRSRVMAGRNSFWCPVCQQ